MKVCIFVLSIVLVIIESQCFPDFLNAIFFWQQLFLEHQYFMINEIKGERRVKLKYESSEHRPERTAETLLYWMWRDNRSKKTKNSVELPDISLDVNTNKLYLANIFH